MAITSLPNGFIFVPREDWGARYSAGRKAMPKGITEINIHHTVTTVRSDPCLNMRNVESVLHQRGLAPGYSYCVDPSGVVLEGAGGNVGAHTAGRNSQSYGIALIGNYDKMQPTLKQLVNIARTVNLLRYVGAVVADPTKIRFAGHRDHSATACPGTNIYDQVINGRTVIQLLHYLMAQNV